MGAGTVGCLIASHLRRTLPKHSPVTLLHKTAKHAIEAQQTGNGLITLENQGIPLKAYGFEHDVWDEATSPEDLNPSMRQKPSRQEEELGLYRDPDAPPRTADRAIQSLIVATKAYSVTDSLRHLLPRISAASTIVLLQNGMGLYEELCSQVFPNPLNRPHFILGVNNHGTWAKKYMHVVHAGIGNMKLGIMPDGLNRNFERSYREATDPKNARLNLDDIFTSVSEDVEGPRYYSLRFTMQALLAAEGLYASWIPVYDLHLAQLRKLVVNSVINPLTALLACPNGDIFKHKAGRSIAGKVCQEASDAIHAQWMAERKAAGRTDKVPFPPSLRHTALFNEAERISRMTSKNYSSMLTDVRKSHPTEIRYLNGYLVALGRRYNVPMPTNEMLLSLMRLRKEIPLYGIV